MCKRIVLAGTQGAALVVVQIYVILSASGSESRSNTPDFIDFDSDRFPDRTEHLLPQQIIHYRVTEDTVFLPPPSVVSVTL